LQCSFSRLLYQAENEIRKKGFDDGGLIQMHQEAVLQMFPVLFLRGKMIKEINELSKHLDLVKDRRQVGQKKLIFWSSRRHFLSSSWKLWLTFPIYNHQQN
jgi:hypothetical protein